MNRVQDARDGQVAAKQQLESALKQFLAVASISDKELKDLEERYDRLNREYERSEGRAQGVHDRIQKVQQVADVLFEEWRNELKQYTNENQRRSSRQQMEDTRRQYDRLIGVYLSGRTSRRGGPRSSSSKAEPCQRITGGSA